MKSYYKKNDYGTLTLAIMLGIILGGLVLRYFGSFFDNFVTAIKNQL